MANWTSVAESFDGTISRLRTLLNSTPQDPDGWLEKLKTAFEEAKKLKKQLTHKQRLLLLKQPAEFDERKSEGDCDDQTEIIEVQRSAAVKRRPGAVESETATKRKRDSGNDRTSPPQPQNLIDPEIRSLFDTLHESYATLESLALECRKRVAHDQALFKRFDDFIWQLVFSSFIVIKHVPALLNVERKNQPNAVICALIGHESQKLKHGMSVFAGLITESQGRELRTTVPKLEYKVQYAVSQPRPRGRTEWVPAVPLQWVDKDCTGTNPNPTGLYLASFYAITVHKKGKTQETSPEGQQSGRRRASPNADGDSSDSKWVGGYHLYFYTMIRSKDTPEGTMTFLALCLPFEILKNYSGQKERKWRDALWRLGFCINDANCTAKKLDADAPTIDTFMEILAYFFRGFVNTSLGLTMIHKLCLKRYLRKFLKSKSEHVDYATFRDKFWSYCFKAVDYIKQNRFLWEKHLLNYCFLDRTETEAVLFHKKGFSFLIRFQESDKAHGFPSISITLPDKSDGPPFFAHSKLQEKINIRNYTLIHCIKYAQLEMCYGKETKGKPVTQKLTDFDVYGKGKCNFGQLEPEDQSNYESRELHVDEHEPCFEYTDERRVLFPIRVREGDQATLSKHLEKFSQTELGKFLSFYGGRTYELMHDQIPQAEHGRVPDNSIAPNSNVESYQFQSFAHSLQPETASLNTQDGCSPQHQQNGWPIEQATEAAYYRPCAHDIRQPTHHSSNSFSSETSYSYHEFSPPAGAFSEAFNCMAIGGISGYDEFGQEPVAAAWSGPGVSQSYSSQYPPSDFVVTNATFSSINGQEYTQLQPLSQQDACRQSSEANSFSPNMGFFESSPSYTSLTDSSQGSNLASPPIYDNGQEIRLEPIPNNNGYRYHQLPQTVIPQQQAQPVVPTEQPGIGQTGPMTEMQQKFIDWIMATPTDQIMEKMKLLGVNTLNQ